MELTVLCDAINFIGQSMSSTIRGFYPTAQLFQHLTDCSIHLHIYADNTYVARKLPQPVLAAHTEKEFVTALGPFIQSLLLELLDLWAFGPVEA